MIQAIAFDAAMMVGNSAPSDVPPVFDPGGRAVHSPYTITASFERHDLEPGHERFARLHRIAELPALLDRLTGDQNHKEVKT